MNIYFLKKTGNTVTLIYYLIFQKFIIKPPIFIL